MTFDDILEQIITLLKRQGRVSYSALKRRFDLDDTYLDDLKDELLYVHEGEVEADERGFTWSGTTATVQPPISQPAQRSEAPTAQQEPSPPAAPQPPEPHPPDAERRQLTVMFCDLADSTRLSGQLDPEDFRDVIRAYQETAAGVIEPYEGHIAQYLGDGLLVYFGWPRAHEDDAQRSVHAALGIIKGMEDLNSRLQHNKGIRLAVRIGLHTGPVVIGEMGGGGRHEQLALGDTPNVASRLQGLAGTDTVAISAATARLVQGYFNLEDLGEHPLKGIAEPMQVYRVQGETEIQSRFEVVARRGLTPLVGREDEMALLLRRWAQSRNGQGQVVLLSGEAGIGKSRLVEVMRERASRDSAPRIAFRCSPYHTHSTLYPVIEHVQRLLQLQRDDTPEVKLDKLERGLHAYGWSLDETVPLLAGLLSVPLADRYAPLTLTPQRQRQLTLDMLVTWLFVEADRQAAVLVVEDLHWVDPSTLEMLSLLTDRIVTVSMLALLTFRPEFQSPWPMDAHMLHLTLNRFNAPQVEGIATAVAGGKRLPAEVVQQVVSQTDGVPLFVEEVTKTILESGLLEEEGDHYNLTGPLTALAIPATLHDALLARLDRLGEAKQVAQLGAALGRTFTYELLSAVARLDVVPLQQALARLVEAELLTSRGVLPQATYTFKHALIQDAAYQSLLRTARQQIHQRTAQVLETQFSEMVATQPELLAHHYTEAGLGARAVPYWQQAGENAAHRSAHVEAVSHLSKGLSLLAMQSETPDRMQRELTILMTLGPALMATRGYAAPDVQHTYARARELCQYAGDTLELFPILMGLCRFYYAGGVMQTARELGEQLLSLAQMNHDAAGLVVAHTALGTTLCFMGAFVQACRHLERGSEGSLPLQEELALARRWSTVPRIQCLIWEAYTLTVLGYPDQALRKARQVRLLSQDIAHPHSAVYTLYQIARLHLLRRERQAARELAEAVIPLAAEQSSALWLAAATFIQGFTHAVQGQPEDGVTQMSQSMTAVFNTGAGVFRPTLLMWMAEAYEEIGNTDDGFAILAEALAAVDNNGQHYNESEIYRLKGELIR
jgi:class 3 adenylate cyclase/tetratricopeptide (TPR) repeat protein